MSDRPSALDSNTEILTYFISNNDTIVLMISVHGRREE